MLRFIRKLLGLKPKSVAVNSQNINVVDSIVKARALYKQLVIKAHPDKNPEKRELAEEITQQLTSNIRNYQELLRIKKIIEEQLN